LGARMRECVTVYLRHEQKRTRI